jgi:hypothetical protein
MSEIFNKPSHLNRIKVMMGLRVYQGHSNANAYIAEQKLRKIVKQRIDDQLWLSFKQRRRYVPSWMVTKERFIEKMVWYIERDRSVTDTLELFYNEGIKKLVTKYIEKRKNKVR